MITYRELINNAKKNIDKVNLEYRAIYEFLMDILNCDRTSLILNEDKEITDEVLDKFADMLSQYIFDYKPIEYILGYTYFCGNKIYVDENVLIPRNETEEVVEAAIEVINKHNYKNVLDLASGSGAISLSVKNVIPSVNIKGSDISEGAIKVAKRNANSLSLDVDYVKSDILETFINNNEHFDMIISNPPYVSLDYELPNDIIKHEPSLALYAKEDGMYFYRKILEDCLKVLNPKGSIVFEIGYNQASKIKELAKSILKDYKIEVRKDISNNDRIVIIEFNN